MPEYIEREALMAKIIADGNQDGLQNIKPEDVYVFAIATVETAPAADVARLLHARWDENGRCTNCGGNAPDWVMASLYHKSPYCCECGARMDAEEQPR